MGWAPSHRLVLDSFLELLRDRAGAQVSPHSPDPMGNPWGLAPASPFLPHHARGRWGGSGQVPLRLSSRQHPRRIGPFPKDHSMGMGSASATGVLSREEMLRTAATPCSLRHCQCDRRQLRPAPSDPERHPAPAPSLFYLFPAAASSRAFLPSLSFPFFLYFGTACCNKYPNRCFNSWCRPWFVGGLFGMGLEGPVLGRGRIFGCIHQTWWRAGHTARPTRIYRAPWLELD